MDTLAEIADDEEELTEAMRRSVEMEQDPSACLSHEDFLKALGRPG